jgi:hypothetical protein
MHLAVARNAGSGIPSPFAALGLCRTSHPRCAGRAIIGVKSLARSRPLASGALDIEVADFPRQKPSGEIFSLKIAHTRVIRP